MTTYEIMVNEFMDTFDQKRYNNLHDVPNRVLKFRADLIAEEAQEYKDATSTVDKLDALCDLIYVVAGTTLTIGTRLLKIPPTGGPNLTTTGYLIKLLCVKVPCLRSITSSASLCVSECRAIAFDQNMKLDQAFEAVHKNNMDKLWTVRPTNKDLIIIPKKGRFLVKNKAGKVIKPLNHTKVNLLPYV